MSVYTNPPEWEAQGKKPPSSKRTEGWKPGDRVPASWLNWFWFSTVNSLREIAQAVKAHSQQITAVHGVGQQYVAKTSRSDQWPSWNDIPDKPSTFPADVATLPQASTSQAGIVQLTNSRMSTREDLALTAKAMNDHRTSADHDDRYAPRSEVQQMIDQAMSGASRIVTGNYTGNGQFQRTISLNFQPKVVAVWPSTIGTGFGQGGSIAIGFAGASASIVASVGVYDRVFDELSYTPGIARAVRHPNFSGSEYDNEHQSGVWPQSNGFMVYNRLNQNGVSYSYMAIG